jgi:hypothetical protein
MRDARAPLVEPDPGSSGINYGIEIARGNIGTGILDCNKPVNS